MVTTRRFDRVPLWSLVATASLVMMLTAAGCALSDLQQDEAKFKQALQLQQEGKLQEALPIYQSLQPEQREYTGVLNNMALIYAFEGDFARAEDTLQVAIGIQPKEVIFWTNLGVLRYHRGDLEAAEYALRQVHPTSRFLRENLAVGRSYNWSYWEVMERIDRSEQISQKYLHLIATHKTQADDELITPSSPLAQLALDWVR